MNSELERLAAKAAYMAAYQEAAKVWECEEKAEAAEAWVNYKAKVVAEAAKQQEQAK
jgi:hypothetical protein